MAGEVQNDPVRVEASYALSPMQAGMLFHALSDQRPGVDIEQVIGELGEELRAEVFQEAWRRLLERHAILRTAFRWAGLEQPRQEVHPSALLPFTRLDWREHTPSRQAAELEALLATERRLGFDLTVPPLIRVALIQRGLTDHLLVWTFHHLLLDGRSLAIALNDLFQIYEALCRGEEPALPPLRAYRDHIEWLQQQDWSKAEPFWRNTLKDFNTPTRLPFGRPVATEGNLEIAPGEQQLNIEAATVAALKTLAKENGLTLNTLVQGAWALLLSRYGGERDVVFGAVRACRHATVDGADTMAGLLINTVPLRVRCPADVLLLDWLKTLRAQWVALRKWEQTPLARIQSWSEGPPGAPLFDTIYNFQDPSWDAVLAAQGGPWKKRAFRILSQPNYPLALDAYGGDRLLLKIIYERGRFDDVIIGRMLNHLQNLLERMPAQITQPLSQVSFLGDQERHQLLVGWNQTRSQITNKLCVQQLFEQQVGKTPGVSALAADGRQLTYREVNRRANCLAHQLQELGVGPNVPVGVFAGRSPAMVVGLLAILKAGGAYVPLDPEYPAERVAFMLRDSAAPVVLTDGQNAAKLPPVTARIVNLDCPLPYRVLCRPDVEANPISKTTPDDLAYIIYTSGSTGTPKGVEILHRGLVNLIGWHQATYQVTPEDRATHLAGLSFDAAVWELWPYLTAGASIHFPDEETRIDPQKLLRWLAHQRITLSFIPTPLAESMLREPWPEGMALRALLTGGDKLHRWPPADLPCCVINHYGPTENTVVTTFAPLDPTHADGTPPPIGRPIANVEVYVLDRDLAPAPVGVPGELFVGGDSLARGYLNRPDLTGEKFIRHPFSTEPGARLYRTGDRVCWSPDGNLEFLDRFDSQVKIRGHRIELGEVESVLGQHPAVQQCVAVIREDEPGRQRLTAYFVPAEGSPSKPQELRRHLQQRLPEAMVPADIIPLDKLPLTPNGKVDRRALPPPEANPDPGDHAAPRNPTEAVLLAIWTDVLKRQRIGCADNFFELGGHSLLATQVASRVRQAFQIDLPVRDLFDFPTVTLLADRIDRARWAARHVASAAPAQNEDQVGGEQPLSFAQERLWFLEQFHPGTPLYNIPVAIRIEGDLKPDALERALDEIMRRHATLRTAFSQVEGKPAARTEPAKPLKPELIDLRHLPAGARRTEANRLAGEEARRPFDLSRGALLRAVIIHLEPDEHLLVLTAHHLVCDGWSVRILHRELTDLYAAIAEGRPSPLEPLRTTYADFVRGQRQELAGQNLEPQLAYWKAQLGGTRPTLELPTDRPHPAQSSHRGATVRFAFAADLSEALTALGRREGTTLFMVLLGAYATLLHRYTGQEDIIIDSPIAGRTRLETENLVGLFLNPLALRVDASGNPDFSTLLQRVRQTAIDAYAHQDVPFEKLVEAVQPDRDLSRPPLFQTMFVLQDAPLPPITAAGLRLTPALLDTGTAKFDLTLSFEQSGMGLTGCAEYSTDLFEEATIRRLIDHYRTLLEGIVIDATQSISRLALLSAAERRQMLIEWNATAVEYPRDKCIHHLFEEQVKRTPNATAVVCDDQALTYDELNQRADRLAGHLRTLGVGPDVPVGLFLKRSLDMVPTLLAILKAGGAYLPLDPAYPQERLAMILEDCQAPVLLAQEELAARLPRGAARNAHVFAPSPTQSDKPGGNGTPAPVTPEHLAYLIYTSGSTGKPKGVMVQHRNVVNFFTGMDTVLGRKPGVWLAVTSLCFDISVLEILWTLTRGFSVVVHTGDEPNGQGPSVPELILKHGVSHLQCTPSLARALLLAPESHQALRSLKMLMLGGEALPLSLAEPLRNVVSGDLLNMYGPTETTVWSTMHRVINVDSPILIGRPIANTQVFILDQHGQPVPAGIPGELHIGGDGVARGYWNQPELTCEKFIPHPFAPAPDARLYRTGDRARYRPDGTIEFLGRLDHQVKIRGHRIELGEIETLLGRHPAITQCVVAAREDAPGDTRLAAYFVSRQLPPPAHEELRRFLEEKLPEVMVPAAFVVLDELPLTPNGKVDRKALPAPAASRPKLETTFSPARTDLEKAIASIWRAILRLDQVGLRDNFFDLGGHSLLVVRVQARLRQELGVEVPLVKLFEHSTIHALAEFLGQKQETVPDLKSIRQRAQRQRRSLKQRGAQKEKVPA